MSNDARRDAPPAKWSRFDGYRRMARRLRNFFLPERGVLRPAPYAAVAAAGLVLSLAVALTGPGQRVEWDTYDSFMRAATRVPDPAPGIVVVALDEPSFAEIGLAWPWPRALHAELVESIAAQGPASVAVDILFEGPGASADGDAALAFAIRQAGNVVLASDLVRIHDRNYSILQPSDPLPLLAEAAAAVGVVSVPRDPDGTLRRATLAVEGRPTLVAAALSQASHSLPPDPGSSRLVRFNGPSRVGIETVSYYQALDAASLLPAGYFRGKHVFVGRSLSAPATDDVDHFPTPVSPHTPGVEVHATVADAVLRNRFVSDPFDDPVLMVTASAALGVLIALSTFVLPPGTAAVATVAVSGLLAAIAYLSLAGYNLRIPVVTPVLAMAGAYAAGAAYKFTLSNRERRLIRRAFEHFVAPAIVNEMLKDPSKLKLGGEEYEVTVLFSDLEGFTSMSERMTPQQLTAHLSEYFRDMIDRLLAEGATLDKLIGDAIMVYFGCPIPDPQHPVLACRAALAMQRRMVELNREWTARGLPPLRVRIGINTGAAIAGNMGTDTIFNFTVLGDSVNLASRLEGVNREYGSLILIGEDTWKRVSTQFETREIDWIRVKGKQKPVAIYELLSEAGSLDPQRRELLRHFAAGLQAYRAGRWADAAAHFTSALEIDPDDGPSRTFAARCEAYVTMPPSTWDGIHVMQAH